MGGEELPHLGGQAHHDGIGVGVAPAGRTGGHLRRRRCLRRRRRSLYCGLRHHGRLRGSRGAFGRGRAQRAPRGAHRVIRLHKFLGAVHRGGVQRAQVHRKPAAEVLLRQVQRLADRLPGFGGRLRGLRRGGHLLPGCKFYGIAFFAVDRAGGILPRGGGAARVLAVPDFLLRGGGRRRRRLCGGRALRRAFLRDDDLFRHRVAAKQPCQQVLLFGGAARRGLGRGFRLRGRFGGGLGRRLFGRGAAAAQRNIDGDKFVGILG